MILEIPRNMNMLLTSLKRLHTFPFTTHDLEIHLKYDLYKF